MGNVLGIGVPSSGARGYAAHHRYELLQRLEDLLVRFRFHPPPPAPPHPPPHPPLHPPPHPPHPPSRPPPLECQPELFPVEVGSARRVVARWRAFVAGRKGALLLRLIQELPDLFAADVLTHLHHADRVRFAQAGAVQVDSIKTRVEKARLAQRLELNCDEPLSNFAFNFILRRYVRRGARAGTR